MSDQPLLTPEILPPQETPEIYGPVSERPQPQNTQTGSKPIDIIRKFVPFIIVFLIVLIILVFSSMIKQDAPQSQQVSTNTPTPTLETLPLSSKTLNAFATSSAFMQFDTTIESLPNVIQQAVLQDPTALPPVLDLPLGFSN